MLASAEMLGYGGRGFLGIFLVGGYVHAELCFQRVLHLAKESAAKVYMVGQFRAEFVGQSAYTFGTWLPGLAPSGCEVAVESGNADVAYAVQMCHQFAEFLFLHIESETRQGAVVDLEIAPQSNIDSHVGMLCSQFCDGGHFHIVVQVYDASAENHFSDGLDVFHRTVEMHFAVGHANPPGYLQFHIAHHFSISPHVVNHPAQTRGVVRFVGIGDICLWIEFSECLQQLMEIQFELLGVEQIERIAMTTAYIV